MAKTLNEHVAAVDEGKDLQNLLVTKSNLERKNRTLSSTLDRTLKEKDDLQNLLDLVSSIDEAKSTPPVWLSPKRPGKGHRATVCVLITDTHFDEVVNPDEVDGINAYNRVIAELRLERCFEKTIVLARDYLAGVEYDGAMVFLGGDIFSGNIHDELKETNQDTVISSVVHWLEPMIAGIKMLEAEFGKVHVAGVVGNHGRNTRKPRHKLRARDNFDWLLYKMIAREFKDSKTVTVQVTDAADAFVQVYDTRYLLTHGDQFRGGSGIAGALSPLMLGTHRKTRRQIAAGRPYDVMVMGHWHQYISIPSKGLLVGGTLKGTDEYAYDNNFEPEPAQQAFWLTTPDHGITFTAPIHVEDRRKEGW